MLASDLLARKKYSRLIWDIWHNKLSPCFRAARANGSAIAPHESKKVFFLMFLDIFILFLLHKGVTRGIGFRFKAQPMRLLKKFPD